MTGIGTGGREHEGMEGSASGTTTLHQPWIPKWGWRGPTNHHPSPLRTHIALEIMTPGITAFSTGMGPAPALLVSPGAGVRGTYVLRLPSLPRHHHQRLGSGNLPTAWTQDRAWRPWAGRTHKVTLPGDAAGPGGAARDGGVGGIKHTDMFSVSNHSIFTTKAISHLNYSHYILVGPYTLFYLCNILLFKSVA